MSTDTTPADNQQLFALIAALEQAQQEAAEQGITVYDLRHRGRDVDTATAATDPQWAGPSLPHPSEAGSEAEADELRQGWDDWQAGIEPNQEQLEA